MTSISNWSWSASTASASAALTSHRRVLSSTSVNKSVTVPDGRTTVPHYVPA
jgi:hypothetical protein